MGYMAHNAIIVTSEMEGPITSAHTQATALGLQCSAIIKSHVNGIQTFLVAPDGSKEGWAESDLGDELRASFVSWLRRQTLSDGSSHLEWCEIRYGSDDRDASVVCSQ